MGDSDNIQILKRKLIEHHPRVRNQLLQQIGSIQKECQLDTVACNMAE